MSKYQKVRDSSNKAIIGCNIRKGITPGGFSVVLGVGRTPGRKSGGSAEDIRAAATEYLIKKGVVQGPFEFGVAAEKARTDR